MIILNKPPKELEEQYIPATADEVWELCVKGCEFHYLDPVTKIYYYKRIEELPNE